MMDFQEQELQTELAEARGREQFLGERSARPGLGEGARSALVSAHRSTRAEVSLRELALQHHLASRPPSSAPPPSPSDETPPGPTSTPPEATPSSP